MLLRHIMNDSDVCPSSTANLCFVTEDQNRILYVCRVLNKIKFFKEHQQFHLTFWLILAVKIFEVLKSKAGIHL